MMTNYVSDLVQEHIGPLGRARSNTTPFTLARPEVAIVIAAQCNVSIEHIVDFGLKRCHLTEND
jgi:hypothetical protein